MNFFKQCLVVLLGLTFLNASAFGAHLHLCLDGKDPRSSLHVFDGPEDIHVGASQGHNDVDVSLAEKAVAKVFKYDDSSAAAPPSVWKAPALTLIDAIAQPIDAVEQTIASIRFLLPPLRGPPA